jgi:hypothetical protein
MTPAAANEARHANEHETKHTPGPWHVRVVEDCTGEEVGVYSGGEAMAMLIADCGYPCPANNANARLMAAAPDLLEALLALWRGFMDGSIRFKHVRQSDGEPYHPANVLMCAAIDKVLGKE